MSYPLTQLSQKRPYSSNYDYSQRKRSKSFKARGGGRLPMATKSAIAKAIAASRETKFIGLAETELSLTTAPGALPYIYPMAIPIGEGTGVEQRIGHQISPINNKFKFLLHNNATQSVVARVIYFRDKTGRTVSQIQSDFFEGVNGLDVPPTGGVSDLIKTPNREWFHIYKDELINLGYENAVGITTPHSRIATGSMEIKPLKKMVFQEPSNTLPVKDMYFVAVLIRRADNDEVIGEEVEFSYRSEMYYKD